MPTRPPETSPSPHATLAGERSSGAVWRVVARARVVQRAKGGLDVATVLSIYVVLLLLVPSRLVLPGLGSFGTPANLFALLMLMWFGAGWLMRRGFEPLPGIGVPRFAVGFLGIAILLSYVALARRGGTGMEVNAGDRGLIQLMAWVSLVLLASSVRSMDRFEKLLRLIIRCASIAALIGIIEFFLRRDILAWIQIPGMDATAVSLGNMVRGSFTRPHSTAIHPLEFATSLAVILPFAIYQAFHRTDTGKLQRWMPVALISLACLTTVSRTAVIGLAVGLLVLIPTWSSQRRWPTVGLLIVGIGAVKVAIPGLLHTIYEMFSTIFSGGDSSTNARTGNYTDIFNYASQSPFAGRGFGTFIPSLYRYTDNMYLLGLVEMGAIGVLAILVLYFAMLHCGGSGRRRFTDPRMRELGQSFTASSVVLLVCTATFDTLSFPQVSGLLFMLLGLAGVYLGMAKRHEAMMLAQNQPSLPSAPTVLLMESAR